MELSKQEFIDRFTHAEFVGVLNSAKTNVDVEAWLFRFNNVTDKINTLDSRTLAGLDLLVTAGALTQARADEISGRVWGAWTVGQNVRVLAPFDVTYPGEYPIQEFDVEHGTILVSGTSFDPQYVEAV
jgi:hypothetical protein